jgi:hypothetical protein
VSDPSDRVPEMPAVPLLDDATVDAILVGDRGPRGVDHLAAFAADVRATAERPPPRPSPALAALLAHGIPAPSPGRATRSSSADHRRRWPALATAAAVASLAGAAAAGVLPGDTDAPVLKVIEVFTPVEFTDDGDPLDQGGNGTGADPSGGPSDAHEPGDDADVPADADRREERDDADEPEANGERGDDGPEPADQVPGTEPQDPAEPADTDADDDAGPNDQQDGSGDATDSDRVETGDGGD